MHLDKILDPKFVKSPIKSKTNSTLANFETFLSSFFSNFNQISDKTTYNTLDKTLNKTFDRIPVQGNLF